MTRRPSFDEMGLRTAALWAERSTDPKHQVGACILSDRSHTLVGIGYNGRYPGSPSEDRASLEVGGSEFIHAEQNAIVRARWEHGESHTLYVSLEPCHACALLILAARHIRRVVFAQEYAGSGPLLRGSHLLSAGGVRVQQIVLGS